MNNTPYWSTEKEGGGVSLGPTTDEQQISFLHRLIILCVCVCSHLYALVCD